MKTFQIKAQGNSMYPILRSGDYLEYEAVRYEKLQINNIVLILEKDTLITHRLIYKKKASCITRGDNNKAADVEIKKDHVIGRVTRFRRKGKWFSIDDIYHVQSSHYLSEIQKLQSLLREYSISHVFLKGVLISLKYEKTIPKRIYADCDILVSKGSFLLLKNVFAELGYAPIQLSEVDSIPYFRKLEDQPEVSFIKRSKWSIPVVFDVHFQPVFLVSRLPQFLLPYPQHYLFDLGKKILKDKISSRIAGIHYFLCDPVDQILYLALHIFHHNYTDILRYQLLDAVIRKTLRKRPALWRELADIIVRFRLQNYVYGVFLRYQTYFSTAIPSSFFAAIYPSLFALYVSRFAIRHVDIFSQDTRTKAGIQRFLLIFLLSPNPIWKKALLIIHPEVITIGIRLIFSFFSACVFRAKKQSAQAKASDYQ